MNTIRHLFALAAILATVPLAPAAVPSAINYQGRLSNASGASQEGNRAMGVKLYDADTGGTLLYSEILGNVAVDANGVYAFQFGASGTSDTLVSETLATTDGATVTYQKALSHTPVLPGSVSVTDGTFGWNETTGNPGSPAHATATVMFGFIVEATVTNGGSGYTTAPAVTITGTGTGAAATATVANGAVTGITITSAGSGYTTDTTITLAPPAAPFVVNYTGGTVTVTYNPAPPTGRPITATYRYSTAGISGALAAGAEQWLELTVDGVAQSPRQKILAVPFAVTALRAETSTGLLLKQITDLNKDVALAAAGLPSSTTFSEKFASSKANVLTAETTLSDLGSTYAGIMDTSNSGYAMIGIGGPLGQNFDNAYVRCAFIRNTAGYSYPLSFTFTYFDDSVSTITGTMTGGNQYIANPNPEKRVKRVAYSIPSNVFCYLSVRANISGNLSISIPASVTPKPKIGLFIGASLTSSRDVLTASLVGTTGSQPMIVNEYTSITNEIGTPKKIIITFTHANSNAETYSTINGYVVRFSE
jgi:hypothetical protein